MWYSEISGPHIRAPHDLKTKNAPRGARTPDPGLIRPMLYQLSYQSSTKPHDVLANRPPGNRTKEKTKSP